MKKQISKVPANLKSKKPAKPETPKPAAPPIRGSHTRHMIEDAVNMNAHGTQIIRDQKPQ